MQVGDIIVFEEGDTTLLGWVISFKNDLMQVLTSSDPVLEEIWGRYYLETYKVCNKSKINIVKHVDDVEDALDILDNSEGILGGYM
jgi:hypothetical protein